MYPKGQKAEIGYTRVSSTNQKTDRQLDGVPLDKIFEDKQTGKDTNRPQLQACLDYLREGDRLHVHSMDRLARSLADLQAMVQDLTSQGIVVKFHKEGLEFTGEDNPMSMLMLQIMGAVAEFERSLIRERQTEGIKKALAKGVKFGRTPKLTLADKYQIADLVEQGQEKNTLAEQFGVSRQTIYRALKEVQA
ncbi:recombinase family protein [uncultured Desulfobacter sp.]|uniref:recombinase family protein n=1 Tax=uncultured Desulfobacter sp. TaxID=240139 RepID=UPI0029F56C41|nr:recombinase family protein [uncultured Desulfobacter sp.]